MTNDIFQHQRHKPPSPLAQPREIVLCCAPMRSNVNLSNIVRTAACCGVTRLVACGNARIERTIARDGADQVEVEVLNQERPIMFSAATPQWLSIALEDV